VQGISSRVSIGKTRTGGTTIVPSHLSVCVVIFLVLVLGAPATPALAGTAQEVSALPTLDALNVKQSPELGYGWLELPWATGGTGHKTGEETTTGWTAWGNSSFISGAYWYLTPYSDSSGDASAITMQVGVSAPGRYVSLWLNMPSPDSVKSGYQLRWTLNSGSNYTVKLSKWASGTETVLASNPSVSIATGTTMAISDTGGAVTAWAGTGGALTSLLSASDAAYASGYAGIEAEGNFSRSINFKAGPLMGAAVGSSSVLDNLERSESPLAAGSWSKSTWAEGIGSARMGSYRGYGSPSGVSGTFWGQEKLKDTWGGTLVAGTVGTGATPVGQYQALWLNMPSPSSARSGYEARFTGGGSASNYKVEISKWSSGTRTVLASTTGFSLPVGTTMALTKSGKSIVLWTGTSALAPVLSTTDGTYANGYAGLEASGTAGTIYNFKAARVGLPPIDTSITAGASGAVLPQVLTSFTGVLGTTSFECSLDAAAYTACTSPKSYPGISEGTHTLRVRALGIQGVDETPAEGTIQVVKPDALTNKVPLLDNLERSESPLATGNWSKSQWAAEIGSARMGSYRGYGSASALAGAYWNQKSFTDNNGTVAVSGTVGTGATPVGQYLALWLDMPTPSSTRSGYEARFTGGGSATSYKVELSKWTSGTRTVLASTTGVSLPVGTVMVLTETPRGALALYTGTTSLSLLLSASDSTYFSGSAGLEVSGTAGTIYNFRAGSIDVQAPETTIVSGPPEIAPSEKASFAFSSNESSTFECSLDGASYASCTSPKSYPGLPDGEHTFRVRAVDGVANRDESPAERKFWTYKQPAVVTAQAPDVTKSVATLEGEITANGFTTMYQFEYGPTTSYGTKAPDLPIIGPNGTLSKWYAQNISGLQPDTRYHYRLAVTSSAGTTYSADRTFTFDLTAPHLTFDSSYDPANPEDYSIAIDAEDPGSGAAGIRDLTILLNGEAVSSIHKSCPEAICPINVETSWSKEFGHALDGTDHLTVIAVDKSGNTVSRTFPLPSDVVHATLYDKDPAEGGKQLAKEWAIVGTHNSRREDPSETTTRGVVECPKTPTASCYSLRGAKTSGVDPGNMYSEAIGLVSEPESLSEAATILIPAQPGAVDIAGNGPTSSIAQPWQVLPPSAGVSYEKVEANDAGSTTQIGGSWIFWIDSATKLPIKVSLQEGTKAPEVGYYSYGESTEEAGEQPSDFFLQSPPPAETSQCAVSGELGSWTFNPSGFVNPSPEFSSVVVGHDGLIVLEPEGAAADGYESRATLTQEGVELNALPTDEEKLTWEVNETPAQILEPAGGNVIVETRGGTPSAVIQPSSASAVSIIDGEPNEGTGESADKVILDPAEGASATITSVDDGSATSRAPCITSADMQAAAVVKEEAAAEKLANMGPEASGSGGSTTPVTVWINPHPALKGVSVTDKYGACNAPNTKTFGEDGRVEFGGCPVGNSVTLSVPGEVTVGSTKYTVDQPSRTFKPPSGGYHVEFNYSGQAIPPSQEPGTGWSEPIKVIQEFGEPSLEAEASGVKPLPVPPPDVCAGLTSAPFRSAIAAPLDETAEAWFKIRCGIFTFVDYWTVPNYRLESNAGPGWAIRKVHPIKGPGPAATTEGPYAVIALCDGKGVSLNHPRGPLWRAAGHLYVFSEKVATPLTNKEETGSVNLACG
jgi:hypothetical protein